MPKDDQIVMSREALTEIIRSVFSETLQTTSVNRDKLLTLAEAVKYTGKTALSISLLVSNGQLRYYMVKRKQYFKKEDLDNYIKEEKGISNG